MLLKQNRLPRLPRLPRSARTLTRVAMSFLLLFFALTVVARYVQPSSRFWDGVLDGSRGAALGVTLGMMFLVLRARRVESDVRAE